MLNISNKTFQLFKRKLAYFFIIIIIIIISYSNYTATAKSSYKNDYSSSRLLPIYQVVRDDQKITLTVDGAWGSEKTEELLKLFEKEDIPVSFFFAGIWLENNPHLVKKILRSGHKIYNHSYSHPHFNSLNREEIIAELLKTEEIINNYRTSDAGLKLFRAPYGEYNNLVIKTARELNYQVIQWSLDSHDWMNPGQEYILNRIKKNIKPGDILLFHNNSVNIVETLRLVIAELKKDYQFVKIEELIYNDNYQINSLTGLQSKIKDDANGN